MGVGADKLDVPQLQDNCPLPGDITQDIPGFLHDTWDPRVRTGLHPLRGPILFQSCGGEVCLQQVALGRSAL